MSGSVSRRLPALFFTAGLASLSMATQSARAADLVGQSAFDLSTTSAHTLNLGGATANKTYSTTWDQTSKNFGPGTKSDHLGGRDGYDVTLRAKGSVGVNISATANAGTATLDFKQLTTTTLKDTGHAGQYKFSTSAATSVGPSFTTTGPSASVNVTGSLNSTDSLHTRICVSSCDSSDKTLLSFGANNFPIVGMTTTGGGSVSVAGQLSPAPAGQTIPGLGKSIPGKYGSVAFGPVIGGLTSATGSASSTTPLLTETLDLLGLATNGGSSALQGSLSVGKIAGKQIGTVSYNFGSATINAIESLVQQSTMNVTSSVDTYFLDEDGAAISLLVKPDDPKNCKKNCLTPTASGFYSINDVAQLSRVAHNAEAAGFLLGDGSVDLGGDQIVTRTSYNVSFQEVLGINLSGTIDLAALQGRALGEGYGPLFSTEINLGGQSFTVYSHTFNQTLASYNTVTIPETIVAPPPPPASPPAPGVPEPATWAMMLVGFGAIGLTLRRRPYAPRAA